MHAGKCLLLLFVLVFSSCDEFGRERAMEAYNLKAEKLIGPWLSTFSKNVDITCIQQFRPSKPLSEEERVLILEKLEIADVNHLAEQIRLSAGFQLTDSIIGNLRLVTTQEQKELERQSDNGEPFWIWNEEHCQGKWLSISRPIFNEDYTLAYFESSTFCGYLCGTGGKSIYKWEEDRWIPLESFDLTIS